MRNFVLLLSTLMGALLIMQNAQGVSLNDALTSGYDNDEELKLIRQDFLSEIEQFPQAISDFMPKVEAGIETQTSRVTPKSGVTGSDNVAKNSNRLSRTITLKQNIFSGGSGVARLKSAQNAFRASRANYYTKEQDAIINQIDIYLSTVESQEKYNISESSVRANRTQYEASKEKLRLGESTETDVASAASGLATAEANQAVAYSNFESAKANFVRVFGVEPVDIAMPEVPEGLPQSLEELKEKALIVNPRIITTQYSTESARAQVAVTAGALMPSVNFVVQHGRDHYNPQASQTEVNRESTTSSLSLNVPILSRGGAEYSDVRRAKYAARKSAVQHDAQIKRITAAAKSSWENLQATRLRIEAASKAVEATKIAYEGIVQEEKLGSKTIVDVLTTEARLNDAKQSKIEAEKALILAAYNIKSLLGQASAKAMLLPVKYFEPEKEFKIVKMKIIGF